MKFKIDENLPIEVAELLRAKTKRVITALRQVGATGPDAETIVQYLAKVKNRQPIHAGGKAASTLIVEERNSHSWN